MAVVLILCAVLHGICSCLFFLDGDPLVGSLYLVTSSAWSCFAYLYSGFWPGSGAKSRLYKVIKESN